MRFHIGRTDPFVNEEFVSSVVRNVNKVQVRDFLEATGLAVGQADTTKVFSNQRKFAQLVIYLDFEVIFKVVELHYN